MLTYPLNKESGRSLYEQLYEGIRRDILSGTLPAHQRLPSKRALAQHLEVSIITVQNAYEQLAAEGYIYSQEKRGYYVSPVERPLQAAARQPAPLPPEPEQKTYFLDLVTNSIDRAYFPFTVWARLMRETLLERARAFERDFTPAARALLGSYDLRFRCGFSPVARGGGASFSGLYDCAVLARRRARRGGRGGCVYYSAELGAEEQRRRAIERQAARA